MPFVFLLVFALISFQASWPPAEWLDIDVSLAAPFALAFVCWLVAGCSAWQFRRQLARRPGEHAWLWRCHLRTRRRLTLLWTAAYLAVLFGLGWGWLAQECARVVGVPGLTELIQFAPYLLGLGLLWWQSYHAEHASHAQAPGVEPFVGPWAYLGFQIRHNLLLVVPPVVLTLALRGVFAVFPSLENDAVLAAAGLVLAAVAIISVPLILRVFLGLRPLPDGPLRSRLEASAQRLGFGFNNILLWNTRRSVANAMVSGAIPWLRYIVLTDLLIEKLSPDEVEAVFGHEVGHVKHHHMLLYILFFIGSLAVMTGVWQLCESALTPAVTAIAPSPIVAATAGWGGSAQVAAGPALLALVSIYVFVVFGYLSRRCERQADLFGCRTVSPDAFISALEKVADLNGIPRHRTGWLTSWQHPTIAERVAFVERLRDNPALEPTFQRSLLQLKFGLMTCLVLSLMVVMAALAFQPEVADGPGQPTHNRVWEMFRVR
jgi:Zn-dependent protease with chaperone function